MPLHRSTALLVGGFVGLGLLYLGVRSDPEDDPDQQIVVVPATVADPVPAESVPVESAPPVTAPSTPAPPATPGESVPTVD